MKRIFRQTNFTSVTLHAQAIVLTSFLHCIVVAEGCSHDLMYNISKITYDLIKKLFIPLFHVTVDCPLHHTSYSIHIFHILVIPLCTLYYHLCIYTILDFSSLFQALVYNCVPFIESKFCFFEDLHLSDSYSVLYINVSPIKVSSSFLFASLLE